MTIHTVVGESGSGKGDLIVGRVEHFDPVPSVRAAVQALAAVNAEFVLIGGVALEAWGIPRATKDVDFAVPVGKAEAAAKQLDHPGVEIRPLKIGGVGVRDVERGVRIDLIDRRFHFGALFQEAINDATEARRKARVYESDVPLVSLEHLLAMKLVSGGDKDDIDAGRILRLEALDYPKARAIIERHLGPATANRADEMARRVGRSDVSRAELYKVGDEGSE